MSGSATVASVEARASEFKRADKDIARQARLLQDAIARHGDELAEFLPGADTSGAEPLPAGTYRLYDEAVLISRLENAKQGSERLLESEIRRARKAGAVRRMAQAPSTASLAALSADYPHFEPVIQLLRQRAALAQVTPARVYSLPPILLVGAGGVGKTAFAEAAARCLALPIRRVDMATSTASFVLSGSHSSWSSARPGAVWSLLHDSASSGVVLVDEIDKSADSSHPPLGPMYRLLEPSSARAFMDEYLEVEIDASNLFWIATCNDAEQIEPALRSRFQEFAIEAPTEAQMPAIAQSVYRERRKHGAWGGVYHLADER